MNDLCYCQYAFVQPGCRVQEIGPGVDPRFQVALIREGPIAAVASRVGLDHFAPERLQGKTAEDIQWLGKVASRHNEIICQAANSSAVLPLRLGTVFSSLDSLQAMLVRCRSAVAKFLEQIGNLQEWGVKLYLEGKRGQSPFARSTLGAVPENGDSPLFPSPVPGYTGPPPPHFFEPPHGTVPFIGDKSPPESERCAKNLAPSPSTTSGTSYLTQKKLQLDIRREQRTIVYQTVQTVEQRLASKAEDCCRIRNLPSDLTGRTEEMVFNAAFLLDSSARASWLETVQTASREVQGKGLLLEVSGPWPPYHFCPSLQM